MLIIGGQKLKMPECSFCKTQYEIPRGLTFVLPNGEILYFCSSKCQKNRKMGRNSKKVNWVRKAGKENSTVEKKQ